MVTTLAGATCAAMGTVVLAQNQADAGAAAGAKRLTLLHMTDTHAQLETHAEYIPGETPELQQMGGFARLKTAIDRERARATGACFLIDGGDEFQGTGPASWSKGEVVVDPLNAFAADAFLPGNWEPVYGPKRFKELMSRLKAPVVCYNFHDEQSGARLFRPTLTLDRGGVKLCVVGITDILASRRQPPDEFAGMDTTRIGGLRDFVRQLRQTEQPDLVVAATHTGLTIARQLARDIPEFDVVLSGHSHERTASVIHEGHVLVVEPGCFGSFLGRLDLALKPGGGVATHSWRMIPIRASEYPEDPHVKSLVEAALKPHRSRMNEVVGATSTPLRRYDVLETNADNFITDSVRAAAGADIGLSNGFRFGVPALAGKLTQDILWSLLPMDTRLKAGWVTGRELKAYLEAELELVFSTEPMKLSGGWGPRASGMTIRYQARGEPGKRLIWVKVNGHEVSDDARYTVAGCEREGEPVDVVCRHKGTHDAKILPIMLHAAVEKYLKDRREIAPVREGRATAADLDAVVFSQDAVLSEHADSATKLREWQD